MIEISLVAIALAYLAGGISGGESKLGSPLIGLAIGALIGLQWYWLPLACLAGFLGEKTSPAKWSHGRIIDGQAGLAVDLDIRVRESAWFEIRKENYEYFNMAIRGLINAVVWVPFYFVIGWAAFLPLAYVISWPLGARLSIGSWGSSEKMRQLICAIFITLMTGVVSYVQHQW